MDDTLNTWTSALRGNDMSPETIRAYTGAVNRCARHAGVPPTALTGSDVAAWLAEYNGRRATRSQYRKGILQWAAWLEDTHRVPDARKLMLAGVKSRPIPERDPDPITTEQLRALLKVVEGNRSSRAMVIIGAYAGFRVHEIAKVSGSDFGPPGGGLYVLGKGQKQHRLQIHPLVVEAAASMPATGLWFPSVSDPTAPRSPGSVGTTITRAMVKAGIPDGHPHQLRAWYATELVRQGVPLTTVRVLMRHSSLATMQAYVRVDPQDCADAVARLPWAA